MVKIKTDDNSSKGFKIVTSRSLKCKYVKCKQKRKRSERKGGKPVSAQEKLPSMQFVEENDNRIIKCISLNSAHSSISIASVSNQRTNITPSVGVAPSIIKMSSPYNVSNLLEVCNEVQNETNLSSFSMSVDNNSKKINSYENKLSHLFDWPGYKTRLSNIETTNSVVIKNTTNIYEMGSSKFLLVLKPENVLYIVGVIEVELLKGSLEVLGYQLNKPNETLVIFSLQGSSHLFLKGMNCQNNDHSGQCPEINIEKLCSLGLSDKTARKLVKEAETSTFLIVNRKVNHVSSSVWPKFFDNHLPLSIFPPNDLLNQESRPFHCLERRSECLFEKNLHDLGLKEFNLISDWTTIEEDFTSQDYPKVVLCGGKSVGKSTLLRYLINRSLKKWDKVLVIDFDIGQCEFTISGCISITLVEEPVLGPNYSHLKVPLRSVFLGEVDVTKCPEGYIEGCKVLTDYAKKRHGYIPWFVNTMGFTRGIGVTLTCGIIRNVSPTHVIQINSKDQKLNFPSKLKPQFAHYKSVDAFGNTEKLLNYKLFSVPSGSEQTGNPNKKSRGISPAEARNLVILSYFSELLSGEKLSLSQITPYVVNMDNIELQTTGKFNWTKAQIAAMMNGSMVALCALKDSDTFPNCYGFGIVRGIDWQTGTLFLITPMPGHILNQINCLVKGNIGLPESLYYNQGKEIDGHIPYLAYTSGVPTSRFARREFRPLSNKR